MKKLFVYGLSIALVAGAASCKKTSKGKMANEWNVTSWESMETTVSNQSGSSNSTTDTETVSADASTITIVSTSSSGGTTSTSTMNGVVNDFKMMIEKDGTWSRTMDVTFTDTDNAGGVTTTNMVTTDEGSWNFLGNVEDEFKKNERVVFNTLSSVSTNNTSYTPQGGSAITQSTSSTSTYANGEMAEILTVVESKGSELMMESSLDMSNSNSYSTAGSSSSDSETTTGTLKITLSAE